MSKEVEFKNRDRFIQLGIAIAALRKMRGMSQEKLAELSNVSRSHISAIEAPGIVRPFSLEVFYNIADALDIDPADLINASVFPDKILTNSKKKKKKKRSPGQLSSDDLSLYALLISATQIILKFFLSFFCQTVPVFQYDRIVKPCFSCTASTYGSTLVLMQTQMIMLLLEIEICIPFPGSPIQANTGVSGSVI